MLQSNIISNSDPNVPASSIQTNSLFITSGVSRVTPISTLNNKSLSRHPRFATAQVGPLGGRLSSSTIRMSLPLEKPSFNVPSNTISNTGSMQTQVLSDVSNTNQLFGAGPSAVSRSSSVLKSSLVAAPNGNQRNLNIGQPMIQQLSQLDADASISRLVPNNKLRSDIFNTEMQASSPEVTKCKVEHKENGQNIKNYFDQLFVDAQQSSSMLQSSVQNAWAQLQMAPILLASGALVLPRPAFARGGRSGGGGHSSGGHSSGGRSGGSRSGGSHSSGGRSGVSRSGGGSHASGGSSHASASHVSSGASHASSGASHASGGISHAAAKVASHPSMAGTASNAGKAAVTSSSAHQAASAGLTHSTSTAAGKVAATAAGAGSINKATTHSESHGADHVAASSSVPHGADHVAASTSAPQGADHVAASTSVPHGADQVASQAASAKAQAAQQVISQKTTNIQIDSTTTHSSSWWSRPSYSSGYHSSYHYTPSYHSYSYYDGPYYDNYDTGYYDAGYHHYWLHDFAMGVCIIGGLYLVTFHVLPYMYARHQSRHETFYNGDGMYGGRESTTTTTTKIKIEEIEYGTKDDAEDSDGGNSGPTGTGTGSGSNTIFV